MSDLGRAVERILTGSTDAPGFRDALREFVAEAGSGRAAARQLGVAESTVRRWRHGGMPRPAARAAFVQAYRRLAARNITPADIRIRTSERASKGGRREREITGRQLRLDDAAAGRVRDAYVAGGREAAAKQLVKETPVSFYKTYLGAALGGDGEDYEGNAVVSEYGAAILA
jgi:DNA-binding transcriptional regulator YdaS (Cro superfamily)